MTVNLPPAMKFQPLIGGKPLPSGKVKFYLAGTTTPTPVYSGDGTPLGTELTLDVNGSTEFRLDPLVTYKVDLVDSLGASQVGWPVDLIEAPDVSTARLRADMADTTGADLLGFDPAVNYAAGTLGRRLLDISKTGAGKGAALVAYDKTVDYPDATLGSKVQSIPEAPGGPLFALKTALSEGLTTGIQILSDSTANDTTDWPYLLAQQLASANPAFTVDHLLWNDASQTYAAPTRIQTGVGGERYLDCASGTYAAITDPVTAVGPSTTSSIIDVRAKVSLTNWSPAATQYLIMLDKGAAPYIGWRFYVNTAGTLGFLWSTDGTAAFSVASTVATGFSANDIRWVRVLFNPNDGSGNRVTKFYTSTDGYAWTQLGTTITTVGTTTVFNPLPTYGYQIGGVNNGPSIYTKVYAIDIRDGDTGPSIFPIVPDLWSPAALGTPQNIVGAPVLTIVNGCNPGANIAYLGNATRLPKLLPQYGQAVVFASTNHNEAWITAGPWATLYKTWTDAIKTRLPNAAIVAMTQNPETTAAIYNRIHARRRLDMLGFRSTQSLEVMDIFKVFMDAGFPGSLMTDSVHPNLAGSTLWATYVKTRIDQAIG